MGFKTKYKNSSGDLISLKGLKINKFAEGGPTDPPKKSKQINYNEFMFDTSKNKSPRQVRKQKKTMNQFANLHDNSNKSCIAGALNCNTDLIAPKLGVKPVRELIDSLGDKWTKHKKKSFSNKSNDYVENNSIDAWEIHDVLRKEKIGTDFFTADANTKYNKSIPADLDLSTIPIGAIIGKGESQGTYTEEKGNRHGFTVVGYDTDGTPMVYDYGKLERIDRSSTLGNTGKHKITKITVPKGYENFTFGKVKKEQAKTNKKLQYDPTKLVEYGSKKKHSRQLEDAVNSIKGDLVIDYNVPQPVVDKLAMFLPGLTNQESKFGNNNGRSKSMIADNFFGNNIAKPFLKGAQYISKEMSDAAGKLTGAKQGERLQDYQMEMHAQDMFPNNEEDRDTFFNVLKEENDKLPYNAKYDSESSVGAFSIKNIPEYSVKKLNLSKSDLYGITNNNKEEIQNGGKVALNFLVENYTKIKKDNPKLTDDQLIDLSLISFNNSAKTQDKEFIRHYIVDKDLKDNYLEKIKNYNTKTNSMNLVDTLKNALKPK
jgi:hypothetical protein